MSTKKSFKPCDLVQDEEIVASKLPPKIPWLYHLDKTGELPKNYKEILAKEEDVRKQMEGNKEKSPLQTDNNAQDKEAVKSNLPPKIPWLHLVSETGELPKNYKQILAKEESERKQKKALLGSNARTNTNSPAFSKSISQILGTKTLLGSNAMKSTNSPAFSKSISQILGTKTLLGSNTTKRQNSPAFKHSQFLDTKIKTSLMKSSPMKQQSSLHTRKKLFNNSPVVKKKPKLLNKNKTGSFKITRTLNNVSPDVSLADISVFEKQVFSRQSTKGSEDSSIEFIAESPITNSSDSSSTKEFVQLENQFQTPNKQKPNKTEEKTKSPNLRKAYVDRFAQIVDQQSELLEEMKEILNHLRLTSSPDNQGILKMEENKENVPLSKGINNPTSILTSTKKKNLRVETLKKTVKFGENVSDDVEKALEYYKMMKSSCSVLQTPKLTTLKRMKSEKMRAKHLSEKIQFQCLMMMDTPKKN